MKLRSIIIAGLLVMPVFTASPAQALLVDDYLFGFTAYGRGLQELILNGGATILQATSDGWINEGAFCYPCGNYFVGAGVGSDNAIHRFHDYFTFSLSDVNTPITSAALSIFNPSIGFKGDPQDFVAHDATVLIPAIPLNQGSAAFYSTLVAGAIFGSAHVDAASNGTNVIVTLNALAVAALNGLEGHDFAVSGTFGADPVRQLPLPASWALFGAGLLGLCGFGYFYRRRARR